MNKALYYLWYSPLWLLSKLPFWVLYRISDFLYPVIYLVGYRKKIILNNLKMAFPDNSHRWRMQILRKFYRHLCDTAVEIVKLQNISEKEMKRRVTFSNTHLINENYQNGKDSVAILAHYGNWEMVPSINLHFKPIGCNVYRPLKNKGFDKFMLDIRSRFGSDNVTMKNTLRRVIQFKRSNTRFVLGLISDQSPGKNEIQYWTPFLTQPTPVITGAEKMTQVIKGPVFFIRLSKPKRGHYHCDVVPFPGNVEKMDEHEITEWHVRLLEQSIRERPELWLWSHKRWKYQHLHYEKTPKACAATQ